MSALGPSIWSAGKNAAPARGSRRAASGRGSGAGVCAWTGPRLQQGRVGKVTGRRGRCLPRGPRASHASALRVDTPLVPAELGRHRPGDAPSASRRRAVSGPRGQQARAACGAAARRRRCGPARGARRARPRRAGRAARRHDRLRQLAALGGDAPARRARRGRSGRRASRTRPRARPPPAAARRARPPGRAGSRACGRARRVPRARRSRSTVIFAIRRQVVSLPPVIVTIPLEVS